MSFTNQQIPLESLPRFAAVDFHKVDPRYPLVSLAAASIVLVPMLLLVSFGYIALLYFGGDPPVAFLTFAYGTLLALIAYLAWFTHKSARVLRYAVRERDVIVHSGVFWKRETVQPIRRIQHIEQHQGPIDKRFGLYELKLFSAGTGHFTFRIPGLDSDAAGRIRQFILEVKGDDWSEDAAAPGDQTTATPADDA